MLESVEGAVICGVINYNDNWCDIYRDKNGTLAFDNYMDGAWCITEINVPETISLPSTQSLINNIESGVYGKCIGVVYGWSGDIAVLLDTNTAVMRKVWDTKTDVGKPFQYYCDMEYDVE